MTKKVFLLHGHDDAAKHEVALFLTNIGLEPIILHMKPNGGRHLLTKFTDESEGASFAVVLMTPDDEGGPAGGAQRSRARQNVVFEIGRLGPGKVAALLKGDVEEPSDFHGVAYTKFDPGGVWKTKLAGELQYAKVAFDAAKVLSA
jgi:predicted nucleotide-binding protein